MRPALVRPADPDFGQAVSSRRSRGVHRSRRLREALPVDALLHENVFRGAETYIRIDPAYFSQKAALAQPPSWGLLCMDAPPPCIQHADHTAVDWGASMRFFRRKRSSDDETERCPRCREPVPEGAAECMMCGLPLEPFRAALSNEEAETQTADRANG
jgi:hypothetical protein